MNNNKTNDVLKRLVGGCVLIIFFGFFLLFRSEKKKLDFNSVIGIIDYYDKTFGKLNKRDHRFIHITGYDLVFDLFIGKRTMDFSPKYEQLDKLKIGDTITVYYADKTPFQKNRDLRLNKTVQFIDKDNEAYFIKGNKDKYGSYFFIGIGFLTLLMLLIGKKMGKIK